MSEWLRRQTRGVNMSEWLRRQTRNLLGYALRRFESWYTSIEHGTNHSLYKGVNMFEWFRRQTRNLAGIFCFIMKSYIILI